MLVIIIIFLIIISLIVMGIASERRKLAKPVFIFFILYLVLLSIFTWTGLDISWLVRIGLIIVFPAITWSKQLKDEFESRGEMIFMWIVSAAWVVFLIWRIATGAGIPFIETFLTDL